MQRDRDIIARLSAAYRYAMDRSPMDQDSEWFGHFVKYHADTNAALYTGDFEASQRILSNPGASKLLYGFDDLYDDAVIGMQSPAQRAAYAESMRRNLRQLAAAIGLDRISNPEQRSETNSTDDILRLESALGFSVHTPHIYPNEFGLQTERGLLTDRAIAAIYQVYRIKSLTQGSVCEIGGGLGRTALYAISAGVPSYTLVDIPTTAVSQGYYLMRALGADAVALPGEKSDAPIRIMAPEDFLADNRRYDLVVNVDSMPELAPATARRYAYKIAANSTCFLSINQEAHRFRVHDLFAGHKILRFPHWMRPGYVEEIVSFPLNP